MAETEIKHKELLHRLNRVQGQIEALKKNLDADNLDKCAETMQLLKAATRALKKFGEAYVNAHIDHCIQSGDSMPEMQSRLKETIQSAFNL